MRKSSLRFIIVWSFLSSASLTLGQEGQGIRIGDYFSLQCIGDWSYRRTNVYADEYNLLGGWGYFKVVWDGVKSKDRRRQLPLNAYLSVTFAGSNRDKPWENNYVFGIGLEKYVFDRIRGVPSLFRNIRIYAEYSKIGYTKRGAEEWVPDYDFRIGFDLYKDFGIGPEKTSKALWAEIWSNWSWQKTNFFSGSYESVALADNIKFGVRLPIHPQFSFMPYCVTEASWTGRHEFYWQNRIILGFGLRIMPFQNAKMDLWNRLKIFVEYIRVVGHFKGDAPGEVPDRDVRAGIAFSVGLWK